MAFIRKQIINGKTYAYEVTSYWDKEKKISRQKSKYLGVFDENSGDIKKAKARNSPKIILDYGDSFVVNEFLDKIGLKKLILDCFGKYAQNILALIAFQILDGGPMKNVNSWISGNIASKIFNANISSQNITKTLAFLGMEETKDSFFSKYIKEFFNDEIGVLIDSTDLPASSNTYINDWGYSSNGIVRCSNCLLLVDQLSKLPIHFKCTPGSIPDVSLLKNCLKELEIFKLNVSNAILDAGFYSNENLTLLNLNGIDFITRIPRNRTLFKQMLTTNKKIDCFENAVKYEKRALFIQEHILKFPNHNNKKIYGYLILDPKTKANSLTYNILTAIDDKKTLDQSELDNCGLFALISSKKIDKSKVLPFYYSRQDIEQVFGFSKSCNNLLPLRTHNEETTKGYLMISFLALVCFISIREQIRSNFKKNNKNKQSGEPINVNEALSILRSIKCKTYNNNKDFIILELTKKQKNVLHLLNIIIPGS